MSYYVFSLSDCIDDINLMRSLNYLRLLCNYPSIYSQTELNDKIFIRISILYSISMFEIVYHNMHLPLVYIN